MHIQVDFHPLTLRLFSSTGNAFIKCKTKHQSVTGELILQCRSIVLMIPDERFLYFIYTPKDVKSY